MTQNNKELLANEWIKRADEDEKIAEVLWKEKIAGGICFHSQQMAEKLLKAFLVFKQGEFPKVHQLDILLKLCIDKEPHFEEYKTEAILLSDYYTETRYPGDYTEFTLQEAEKALHAAQRIKTFVLKKLK